MKTQQFYLLKTRRFLPFFITQFLGAFNDSVFKGALIALIIFYSDISPEYKGAFAGLATGLFVLPFLLFSALAGQISDKYEKSNLTVWIKLTEVVLMILAVFGFYSNNISLLLLVIFLMGTQSTFFGPVKYAILPDLLCSRELLSANAWVEAATFLAILIGSVLGGLLMVLEYGILWVSSCILITALLGLLSSWFILKAGPASPDLEINYNLISETRSILDYVVERKYLFLSILGISWFWVAGIVFTGYMQEYARATFAANVVVAQSFLGIFSIGIAMGSLLCNRLLNGAINAKYVPLGVLGMTIFLIDLYFASNGMAAAVVPEDTALLIGVGEFFSSSASWRIAFDLLMISVCGGFYIVPLYTLLQHRSPKAHRSRVIASNNIINSFFMIFVTLFVGSLLLLKLSLPQIFLIVGILNGLVALYICKILPDFLIKQLVRRLLKFIYKVEVKGIRNYRKAGKRVVVIANHNSFIDGLLIAAFLPGQILFAINRLAAQQWWIKPFISLADVFPVDQKNPMAIKTLIRLIQKNKRCLIFPEGRITVTGGLMKIYEGPGMIADKANAFVLPIRIDGSEYTYFSRLRGKTRLRWFPKITLTILEPKKFTIDNEIKGRKRRYLVGNELYHMMVALMFDSSNHQKTLFQALLDARSIYGGRHQIAEDIERKPVNYDQLLTRCFILGKLISHSTKQGENVGIMLPSMVSTAITFFAMQAYGRVPVMLNFSMGLKNVFSSCQTAQVKVIYTSKRFVDTVKLHSVIASLIEYGIDVIYLEDFRSRVSFFTKLAGFLKSKIPEYAYRQAATNLRSDEPATILFTSGSEGAPKGVVLSHENIISNCNQLQSVFDFLPRGDKVFNALPLFHVFGLTGGTILPMIAGVKTFFYPSPLHYRVVPELIYDTDSTIMFGTDTFLAGYGRFAHPYDFYKTRYVFAGAEKLKQETQRLWFDKFGVRIFEAYGVTEASPGICVNTPMRCKPGSVGSFLPGIDYRLEPVPGIENGGRLLISGPNIMLGYLLPDNPGKLVSPVDGWHDTGDIVAVDKEGYVSITGRVKRFAKIAGEMISLTAVETHIGQLWPDNLHAVVSIPDLRKGEQLVLLTEYKDAQRVEIAAYFRAQGIAELSIPRQIKIINKMPLLPTGKTNYAALQEMVS